MEKEAKNYGRAYVFMDLEASKKQVEDELPRAREVDKTPSQLEISVREVKELIADKTTDLDLVRCMHENEIFPSVPSSYSGSRSKIKQKRMSDLRYVLEAKYPGATNEQTSEAMNDIPNHLYNTFNKGRPFYAINISKAPDGQYRDWEID